MAKLPARGLDGRWTTTKNTAEAAGGKFGTYAGDLPVENISADARGPLVAPRHGPQADELPAEPVRERRAIIITAMSGQHLGTVDQDALRHAIGRRSGHLADHVDGNENYPISGK